MGRWSGLDCEIKGSGPIMSNFWGPFFHFFRVKKNFKIFFENIVASALKSCIIPILQFIFFLIFWTRKSEKTGFFRANTQISNLDVLHKGLLLQDWVFRLGLYTYFQVSNHESLTKVEWIYPVAWKFSHLGAKAKHLEMWTFGCKP